MDFPQLLTAERLDTLKFNADKYMSAIEKIHPYQHLIKGIHIWGKKKNPKGRWIAHCGNLDTYNSEIVMKLLKTKNAIGKNNKCKIYYNRELRPLLCRMYPYNNTIDCPYMKKVDEE